MGTHLTEKADRGRVRITIKGLIIQIPVTLILGLIATAWNR